MKVGGRGLRHPTAATEQSRLGQKQLNPFWYGCNTEGKGSAQIDQH